MSSFDKVVKLACKPKAAPPKAKYLDPIIAATWSDDGAVHDVCKALAPRFREPNVIVVFKALIVLHTMIRNGATDNVLSYLTQADVLKLKNVSSGNWEGVVFCPQNLQNYAIYLDARIRAYRELKHDAIRVQSETNRDMRNSVAIDEEIPHRKEQRNKNKTTSTAPTRSKTIMGRKLRMMTVEKGLLRETKAVHSMIDTLVECRFYLDDLEDELTITALRMLVKDLLILFQAGNEGVINVLEHYFEMSHVDAEEALTIYRRFCKQTEHVVEYLGVAKKLQNLLNVPIPNLKHAPVSLAGALQEYLDDPNFEQNRIEYRTNKEAVERGNKRSVLDSRSRKQESSSTSRASSSMAASNQGDAANGSANSGLKENKDIIDFFSAIEEEQPTMFNPQTNSPTAAYFQQQAVSNPFAQMMANGGFPQQSMSVVSQPTGFLMPQNTAVPHAPNPFSLMLQQQQQQLQVQHQHQQQLQVQQQQQIQQPLQSQSTGQRLFSTFLHPQQTGFLQQPQQTAFLQPQSTGANPFRQSMLFPQSTGMPVMNNGVGPQPNNFMKQNFSQQGQNQAAASGPFTASGSSFLNQPKSPFASTNVPPRPSSTPLTSFGASSSRTGSPPVAHPVKTHQTGTKNPFGPVVTAPPPVPRPPTLMELATGSNGNIGNQNGQSLQQQQQQQPHQQSQSQQSNSTSNGFSFGSSALNPGGTDMSNVASSFLFSSPNSNSASNKPSNIFSSTSASPLASQNTATTATESTASSLFSPSFTSASLSTQPTGASTPSIQLSGPVKSHATGFAGLKPFKPTSSFGASLLESLPSIPGSSPNTPSIPGAAPAGFGSLSSQSTGATGGSFTGSTIGQGLRPQMTGAGGANPFRLSMMTQGTGVPNFSSTLGSSSGMPTTNSFNSSFGSGGVFGTNATSQQPQQNGHSSLI
ncbi:ANTH domain-containing protein [Cyathus striatus]|nr:ANTH domain-containing protein [Cyathus striatus]